MTLMQMFLVKSEVMHLLIFRPLSDYTSVLPGRKKYGGVVIYVNQKVKLFERADSGH